MKRILVLVSIVVFVVGASLQTFASEKKELVFGAIAVGKVSKVRKALTPLINYISAETGATIRFETGKDYKDTIDKFKSGYFDFGYIGPSPYVIATKDGADVFKLIAGVETNNKPFFHAAIIAAKNNNAINTLADLKGRKFAFGSRQSTLSCYVPAKMLLDAEVFDTLAEYKFLGKHDKVARNVAMGGSDAGGIKIAVANKNLERVKIIAKSEPVYDFLLVAHKGMDQAQFEKIKKAVLKLKDQKVLTSIKKGVTGFSETKDSNYDGLRTIMTAVDKAIPQK